MLIVFEIINGGGPIGVETESICTVKPISEAQTRIEFRSKAVPITVEGEFYEVMRRLWGGKQGAPSVLLEPLPVVETVEMKCATCPTTSLVIDPGESWMCPVCAHGEPV